MPTLAIIRQAIAGTPGVISIEGHTDSIPINTRSFGSNWALSSARAVSVAHGLFEDRFSVKGYAETNPLVNHDSSEIVPEMRQPDYHSPNRMQIVERERLWRVL